MASRPNDFMEMDTAVSRLAVNQREPVDEDSGPQEPVSEYDEDTRLLMGEEPNDQVELVIDGKKVLVDRDQLAPHMQQQPIPQLIPAAPLPVDTSHITKLDSTIQQLQAHMVAAGEAKMPPTTLIAEDPEAYNLKMAEYNELRARKEQAGIDLNTALADRQAAANQAQQQMIIAEQAQLASKWKEWGNERTRPRVTAQIRDYAMRQGYSVADADLISQGKADHRLVLAMRDGLRGEILSKKPNTNRKKDKKAPVVGKPGPAQTEVRQKSGKRNDFLQSAERSGTSIRGAAEFLAGKYS